MITIPALSIETGHPQSTIRAAIYRLGLRKDGRDYHLTDEQAKAVLAEIKPGPGRPRVDRPVTILHSRD